MQERGFSLIELLIVVAIILIIAAIAIPSYLHSKIAANESSAVYSIRTINTAQVTYASTYPTVGYATTLNALAAARRRRRSSSANAGILDWVLGCTSQLCPKSGYNFQISVQRHRHPGQRLQRLGNSDRVGNHRVSRILLRQYESGLCSIRLAATTAPSRCNSSGSSLKEYRAGLTFPLRVLSL